MKCLSVLALAYLLQTTPAHASGCYLGPFTNSDPAINCQVVVHHDTRFSAPAPKLTVMRDGTIVDVTGTVDKQTVMLPVEYPETDCSENVISSTTNDEPYDVYHVAINGGLVGEELFVDGMSAGRIQAAVASCVEPAAPMPVCGHLPNGCDYNYDDDDGGCSSGHGAGIALAGIALLFVRRRRR